MTANVVLVGMPGAGKSTIGHLLAGELERKFIDTDQLIEMTAGKSLQQIVDEHGAAGLRQIEEQVILNLDCQGAIIATGGSAIYSEAGMAHLARNGLIVYLKTGLAELTRRIGNLATRGLLREPGQTLEDLFRERVPLYERYADITVSCEGEPTAIAEAVIRAVRNSSS